MANLAVTDVGFADCQVTGSGSIYAGLAYLDQSVAVFLRANVTRVNAVSTGGSPHAAVVYQTGATNVSMTNSAFNDTLVSGTSGTASYGGVFDMAGASLATVRGCKFVKCHAHNSGADAYGGVFSVWFSSTIEVYGSSFLECAATGGSSNNRYGGVAIMLGGQMSFDGCTVDNCTAGTGGGFLYVSGNSVASVRDTIVRGCSAPDAGAYAVKAMSTLSLTGGSIIDCTANAASAAGGAIAVESAGTTASVHGVKIIRCKAAGTTAT
eukprot:1250348-Prymnesium_polylepis.1